MTETGKQERSSKPDVQTQTGQKPVPKPLMVSVIVPVYQVEKYLDRCIDSIVSQSWPNLEIILVDDGSPDQCPQICDRRAQEDSRIRVIHKQNQGLGMARNSGLQKAEGDAVCFVDSDDYLELNAIEKSVSALVVNQADIVCYSFYETRKREGKATISAKMSYEGRAVQDVLLPALLRTSMPGGTGIDSELSACLALFSMNLIRKNGWCFVSEREIISEDIYSLLKLYCHIRKAVVLPDGLYHYCRNEESLTHTYRKDRYPKIVEFYHRSVKLARDCGYSQTTIERLSDVMLSSTIAAMKLIEQSDLPVREKMTTLYAIACEQTLQQILAEHRDYPVSKFQQIFWKLVMEKNIPLILLMLTVRRKMDR